MAYLRFVPDNAATRATIVASSTAGSLGVSNMLTHIKSKKWRSTSTTATLTLTWSTAEFVGCVCLPFNNLTTAATLRLRLYTNSTDPSPVYDSGYNAVMSDLIQNIDWGTGQIGISGFSGEPSAYAVMWADTIYPVHKVVIDMEDPSNEDGYIESSNLVVGGWWSPENGADYGATITVEDSSSLERTDAGDLFTDRGCSYRVVDFTTPYMTSKDKTEMYAMLRKYGMHTPVFVSLIPGSDEPTDEHIYQVYGKLSKSATISFRFLNQFDVSLTFEEL